MQPWYPGPEPLPPQRREVHHAAWLIGGFVTCGIAWAIWPLYAIDVARANRQAEARYRWEHQQWFYQNYRH